MKCWKLMQAHTIILLGLLLSGCQKDFPKFESKPNQIGKSLLNFTQTKSVVASNLKTPSLFVQYKTRGKNLFVECIVSGVSFRVKDHSAQRLGKMIVWIDGKKNMEVSSAAFIIKQLPYGNHKLKLEVVNLQNEPYGLSKEFMVNIPKM